MSPDPPDLPVPVEPVERVCPGCYRMLPADAVVCVECGWHRERRAKVTAPGPAFRRTWNGWGIVLVRLVVFATMAAPVGWFIAFRGGVTPALAFALAAGPAAFLFGSFSQVTIGRRADGRGWVTRRRWLAFIPLWARRADLTKYESVKLLEAGRVRLSGIDVLLELLTYEMFDLRALEPQTWWNDTVESYRRSWQMPWDERRYDTNYNVPASGLLELRGYGMPRFVVYWGRNEDAIGEMVRALRDAAGLTFGRG